MLLDLVDRLELLEALKKATRSWTRQGPEHGGGQGTGPGEIWNIALSSPRRWWRKANERHDWVAENSPERADKWYRGLFEKIKTLKTFPNRCPVAPERGDYGEELHCLTYGKTGRRFSDPLHDPR